MARVGIYKSDVQNARNTLLAQGKHPSIDAVRMAMGNTGSKTTIHRYLRELEQEEGADESAPVLDEAILSLVKQLAATLQANATAQIDSMREELAMQSERQQQELERAQQECDSLQLALAAEAEARQQLTQQFEQQRESLQAERIMVAQLEQQQLDMQLRLGENEAHRQSLEDKHQHAHLALEHYRESVRQQREQELQKHDQQMQQWQAELRRSQLDLAQKQQDLTALHQELARQGAQHMQLRQQLQEQAQHYQDKERQYETLREQHAELKASLAAMQAGEQQRQYQEQAWQVLSGQMLALQKQLAANHAANTPEISPETRTDDCPTSAGSDDDAANPPAANR